MFLVPHIRNGVVFFGLEYVSVQIKDPTLSILFENARKGELDFRIEKFVENDSFLDAYWELLELTDEFDTLISECHCRVNSFNLLLGEETAEMDLKELKNHYRKFSRDFNNRVKETGKLVENISTSLTSYNLLRKLYFYEHDALDFQPSIVNHLPAMPTSFIRESSFWS